MSLPQAKPKWNELPAKLKLHDAEAELRLQCFLLVRDPQERVALLKLKDVEGWAFPGETMRFNESPDEAVARVASGWFTTPPRQVWLERVLSFPATGPADNRWYLLFVYGAEASADLKPTSDTEALEYHALDAQAPPLAFSHRDVWAALRQ